MQQALNQISFLQVTTVVVVVVVALVLLV